MWVLIACNRCIKFKFDGWRGVSGLAGVKGIFYANSGPKLFSSYKYDILYLILYIFSHMKKVITLSLSLSLMFYFCVNFFIFWLYFRLMYLCVL